MIRPRPAHDSAIDANVVGPRNGAPQAGLPVAGPDGSRLALVNLAREQRLMQRSKQILDVVEAHLLETTSLL